MSSAGADARSNLSDRRLDREADARPAPSPNAGPRVDGRAPTLVVLHYTGMASAEAALARLCDPRAEVSAHYLIDAQGALFALVDEADRAWHAGVASWRGETDVNGASIGVELAHLGREDEGCGPYHPFSEPQIARLEALLASIGARWGVGRRGVVAHSDVAPERKTDPGEKFDWARLEARGLALGPFAAGAPFAAAPPEDRSQADADRRFRAAAARIGYGNWSSNAVLTAFRRRFAPARLGAPIGPADAAAAEAVAELSENGTR